MTSPLTENDRSGLRAILVPTDFSESSSVALGIAVDLAKQQNARIYLLHVVSFGHSPDAQGMLKRQLSAFPEAQSLEIVPEIRKGKAHEEILKEQAEKNIDLIIIARHGKARFLHTLFRRSVTEKIRKKAQCSVLVAGV